MRENLPLFNCSHILVFLLLLFSLPVLAQSKKGKKINIKNAESLIYQQKFERNRLIGNVVFEHEGAIMYCDSAWAYSKKNTIKAFQNVRINQGDTLHLTGDYLEYDGNTKLATVTGEEVKLRDPEMTLITTRLDLDRKSDVAYYSTGGTITNQENILVSNKGFYNTQAKIFNFKDSVVLTNPDYVMYSDTLHYHSSTRYAYFLGPTTIISDSSFIYCENGLYNTVLDIAQFDKNAYIYDDNKYLTGDSIYYEKKDDFGEVFGCMFLHDTVENYVLTGNYGQYKGNTDSAFVTNDPVYSVVQEGDTLHIHGDTLFSTIQRDSLKNYRLVQVFHHVKYFKSDLQGMCDSLTYSTLDSTFRMYFNPVIWSDSSQITGDTIYLSMRKDKLDSLKVYSNAFILNEVESDKHNQIKGRTMFGKFSDNKLRKVFVNGNGQTIYFPKDDKEEFIGLSKNLSSYIIIRLKDNEVQSVTFLNKPDSKLFPLDKVPPGENQLEGFTPRFEFRPKSKGDLLK